LGDLNNDGILDQAYVRADQMVTQTSSGYVGYWTNEVDIATGVGDATFAAASTAASLPLSSTFPTLDSVRIARISSTVNRDLVIATPQALSVLPGNGNGTFQAPVNAGGPAGAVVTSDLNGDGKNDLADAPLGSAEVQVLANASTGG
jgi:FG-GAP-like repeat